MGTPTLPFMASSWPEWAVAGGTFALAIATAWMAWKTRGVAQATEKEAKASLATVDEIRKDRELTFRPYLSWVLTPSLNATNNGRGPALNSVFCALEEDP